MKPDLFEPAKSGLRDLKTIWEQLLLVGFTTRCLVALVLLPGIALLLRLFLSSTGRGVLRDEEILDFFLSMPGFLALMLVGGAWIGAALIEQAALMTIGLGASENRRLSGLAALRFVAARLHAILLLGSHLLARLLIISLPFIAPAIGVYLLLLGKHDINYYLQEHPPEFIQATAIIGTLIAAMLVLLTMKISSWFLALPILIFENLRPHAAIQKSAADTRGHRRELCGWLIAWLAASSLASFIITWLIGFAGHALVSTASESLGFVAFAIGAVGVFTVVANGLISILSAALFALIMVRLYRKYSGPGPLPTTLMAGDIALTHRALSIPGKKLILGLFASIIAAFSAMWLILANMPIEDDVLIIAHRGSAATAPENTMAAIHDALDANTDFVEIDVQETADGEVVVFHDSDFMKTARQPLKIWDAKRADLARLDIGSWFDPKYSSERTPSLSEVLKACKGRSKVDIELKYYGHDHSLEQKVVDIVEREQMAAQVIVMSLKYDKVQKIKAIRPTWTYGLLTTVSMGDIAQFDVDFLGVSSAGASRAFIRRAHKCGHKVYVWTVNDPFQMSAMMSRGADGIITDDPALAKRVLKIRAGLNPVERLLIGIGTEVGAFTIPDQLPSEDDA